jgi:hypothetical protein
MHDAHDRLLRVVAKRVAAHRNSAVGLAEGSQRAFDGRLLAVAFLKPSLGAPEH